jgi:DNA-binding transcriptional MerR regulator
VSKSTLRFYKKKIQRDHYLPSAALVGSEGTLLTIVVVIELIKALKEEGLSLEGIGQRINPAAVVGDSSLDEASFERLADRIAALFRVEVRRFFSQDPRTKNMDNETARL